MGNQKGKFKGNSKHYSNKGNKPPYRGKSSQRGNKNDKRAEEIADTAAAMSRDNPVSFYTKFSDFARDAASIPFATPVGGVLDLEATGYNLSQTNTYATPGIMRIVFSPSVGVSSDFMSPLNRSSVNFYGRLRSTQKAFGDYDHQDLTMMMLSIDSLLMYHALGRRIYGLLRDMTPINKYYPRNLIQANGMQYTATVKQIQDFRAFLNEMAILIEQYALPNNIELFKRHQWMCEGIYTDSAARKAQTYIFVPRGFWQYNNTAETGSQLDYVPYILPGDTTATQYTVEEFMQIGQNLINAVSNDADFATMSGDLYAYYGGNTLKLPYIDESYMILPNYSEVVLSQIENAVIVGDWSDSYTPVISQNPNVNQGAIIFEPEVKTERSFYASSVRINMHKDSPTPDDVIEATRLVAIYGEPQANNAGVKLAACASEIVHFVDIWVVNPATNLFRSRRVDQMTQVISRTAIGNETTGSQYLRNHLEDLIYTESFDWAPRYEVYLDDPSVTDDRFHYCGCTWDLDNVTTIPVNYLKTIHTACLFSLFDVATR